MFSLFGIRSFNSSVKISNALNGTKTSKNLNYSFNSKSLNSSFSLPFSSSPFRKYSNETEGTEEKKVESGRQRFQRLRNEERLKRQELRANKVEPEQDPITRDYQPKGKNYFIKTRPSREEFMKRHIKRLRTDPALDKLSDYFLTSVTTGKQADKYYGPIHKIHKYTKKAPIRPKREVEYRLYPDLLKQPKVPRNHHFFPNDKLIIRPNRISKSPKGPEYREVEFKVAPHMGKKDIETYLTQIYKLKVVRITTANYQGKKTVLRSKPWLTSQAPDWKKANVLFKSENPEAEFDSVSFDFVTQPKPKQKDEETGKA